MKKTHSNDEIIIVGAGPVGLTAAIQLQRYGIKHRIVEKRMQRQPHSKAFAIHSRSLEVFEDLGIFEQISNQAHLVRGMKIYSNGKRLIDYDFKVLDIPHQYVASIPQNIVEDILQQKYQQLGGNVEHGVELKSIEQNKHCINVSLESNGLQQQTTFKYMIAADGTKSTVRELLNIPFHGSDYPTPYIIADGKLEWQGDPNAGHVYVSGGGYIMFFPLPNGLWRVVVDEPSGKLTPEQVTPEIVNQRIRDKGLNEVTFSEPVWLSTTRFKQRLINDYRCNNVYFAGDACHVHSPIGGQGLNTGIQDAYNLAWKLSHSILYKAKDRLLTSYSTERKPVAQLVLDRTNQQMKLLSVSNPVIQLLRDFFIPKIAKTAKFQKNVVSQAGGFLVNYQRSEIVPEDTQYPLVGNRMPDILLTSVDSSEHKRLFKLFAGTHYSLLLIGDALPLSAITAVNNSLYVDPDFMRVFWIKTSQFETKIDQADLSPNYQTFIDSNNKLKGLKGFKQATATLVRPDGYVAMQTSLKSIVDIINFFDELYEFTTLETIELNEMAPACAS